MKTAVVYFEVMYGDITTTSGNRYRLDVVQKICEECNKTTFKIEAMGKKIGEVVAGMMNGNLFVVEADIDLGEAAKVGFDIKDKGIYTVVMAGEKTLDKNSIVVSCEIDRFEMVSKHTSGFYRKGEIMTPEISDGISRFKISYLSRLLDTKYRPGKHTLLLTVENGQATIYDPSGAEVYSEEDAEFNVIKPYDNYVQKYAMKLCAQKEFRNALRKHFESKKINVVLPDFGSEGDDDEYDMRLFDVYDSFKLEQT